MEDLPLDPFFGTGCKVQTPMGPSTFSKVLKHKSSPVT